MGGVCVCLYACVFPFTWVGSLVVDVCCGWMINCVRPTQSLISAVKPVHVFNQTRSDGWKFPAKNGRESIKRHCEHEGRGTALS